MEADDEGSELTLEDAESELEGELDLDEYEVRTPSVIGFFSGANAPLEQAFVWCGWNADAVDILIDKSNDLTKEYERRYWKKKARKVDAIFLAVPCDTTSRIREHPIPGHKDPPKPLRDQSSVRGIRGLKDSDKKRVEDGNMLIDFTFETHWAKQI